MVRTFSKSSRHSPIPLEEKLSVLGGGFEPPKPCGGSFTDCSVSPLRHPSNKSILPNLRYNISMSSNIKSICLLSVHTCPVAALGGKKTGGMNVYIRDLARELGARGIKVDIFTRCESKDATEVSRLGPNVQVIHIPSGPSKTLDPINIYPHLKEFTRNVLAYQEKTKHRYDLIHSHYWLSGLVALSLRNSWHIPILQTFHTLFKVKQLFSPIYPANQRATLSGAIYQPKSDINPNELAIRPNAEEKLIVKVNHILAFTPDEKHHLVKLYAASPQKISLIPPGIDIHRFHPIHKTQAQTKIGLKTNHRLLLFVGRLDPIKNLETLLTAIAQPTLQGSSLQGDKLCLAVIGGEKDDKYFIKIKNLSQKLKLQHFTTFFGSRDQRVLPYYYSAAEMTIIPSSYESFGLVALESMACATPVIASKVGGLKYLITDHQTGLLIPPVNPHALSQAVGKLLTHPTLHHKLSQAAHRQAQKYSWSQITPQILKLYSQILYLNYR